MSSPGHLLFVCWDSAESNYLESLFFPVFKGVQEKYDCHIHVMQFSWADPAEVLRIGRVAKLMGLRYVQYPIHKKPFVSIAALWSVYQGVYHIRHYVKEHAIDIVLPRSTMPAMMVNRLRTWLRRERVSVVFDADGFPLEERVDFAGLSPKSLRYRKLKKEEMTILKTAKKVLTRSQKSIEVHVQTMGEKYRSKFSVLTNGRDPDVFKPDAQQRREIRQGLELDDSDYLWVYTGTLGKPYEVERMLSLFAAHCQNYPRSKFLFLTRDCTYLDARLSDELRPAVKSLSVDFGEIPGYLAAADLGLSLRLPAPSLAGLFPIKLGEYLLTGLPVIVTPGIGDTDEWLMDRDFCFVLSKNQEQACMEWLETIHQLNSASIRSFALTYFSLSKSIDQFGKGVGLDEGR